MFLTLFGFVRGIHNEVKLAIGRGRQRSHDLLCHPIEDRLSIPFALTQHANQRPIGQMGWQIGTQALERARSWITNNRHQKPAENHKVARLRTAKKGLEGQPFQHVLMP